MLNGVLTIVIMGNVGATVSSKDFLLNLSRSCVLDFGPVHHFSVSLIRCYSLSLRETHQCLSAQLHPTACLNHKYASINSPHQTWKASSFRNNCPSNTVFNSTQMQLFLKQLPFSSSSPELEPRLISSSFKLLFLMLPLLYSCELECVL